MTFINDNQSKRTTNCSPGFPLLSWESSSISSTLHKSFVKEWSCWVLSPLHQTCIMQHVDDFWDKLEPVCRNIKPEVEGFDKFRAYLLAWRGGYICKRFKNCLGWCDYWCVPRGYHAHLFLFVWPYGIHWQSIVYIVIDGHVIHTGDGG